MGRLVWPIFKAALLGSLCFTVISQFPSHYFFSSFGDSDFYHFLHQLMVLFLHGNCMYLGRLIRGFK